MSRRLSRTVAPGTSLESDALTPTVAVPAPAEATGEWLLGDFVPYSKW
jgi:hypothetical protein